MNKGILRHHRIDNACADGTDLEVWDDDGDNFITLVIEPPKDSMQCADISPSTARALAALLIMAAENCEGRIKK